MKIAIKFGDNDFHATFLGVLKTLLEIWEYRRGSHYELTTDKPALVEMINELSLGHYLARQLTKSHFGHNVTPTEQKRTEHIEHIRKYLKITEEKLMVDGEVDRYLKDTLENNNFNSSTFILDTDLDHENNAAVYSI